MAYRADGLMAQPGFPAAIREQAQAFTALHAAMPRHSAVFATQQRWLLAHLALALHLRGLGPDRPPLTASRFLETVEAHKVAARYTAHAFKGEMLKYGLCYYGEAVAAQRSRPIRVGDEALQVVDHWLRLHLTTLDRIDGGGRLPRYATAGDGLARLQPAVADRLLTSPDIREPSGAFALFTWVNHGGLVMDCLIGGLGADPTPAGAELSTVDSEASERLPTAIGSATTLAARLGLSRTHLSRKLREAEDLGAMGWTGARGRSTLWVSAGFCAEYHRYQAVKLAIIDDAFAAEIGGL